MFADVRGEIRTGPWGVGPLLLGGSSAENVTFVHLQRSVSAFDPKMNAFSHCWMADPFEPVTNIYCFRQWTPAWQMPLNILGAGQTENIS